MPIQSSRLLLLVVVFAAALVGPVAAAPIRIVALGDSLTAGYGLAPEDAFPAKLEAALKARGHDVTVANAGVSGDTAADGLARLDWSVPADTQAVIVELGANDALRGLDPERTRATLDAILARLAARHLPVLLAGMLAPPNLGQTYADAFNPIYPALGTKYGAVLYPFFLDGVATRTELVQTDGLHPNPAGVEVIVARILPSVETLLARLGPS